ncbi:MAG TPA: MarR family transcriptional regulator [Candidatus Thermoplasmatota archaeon]|nr:MarR family transcriptional regulator [Candidatus Thermoplasmatota archaeon]
MRRAFAIVALLALAPSVDASTSFALETAAPLSLHGDAVAETVGGALRVTDEHATGGSTIGVVSGELVLVTWEAVWAGPGEPVFRGNTGEPRSEVLRLDRTTIRLVHDEPMFTFVADAREGGTLGVRGAVDEAGAPVRLLTSVSSHVDEEEDDRDVRWRWEAGWWFLGVHTAVPAVGFPTWDTPRLGIQGPVALHAYGGRIEFEDADGNARVERLGRIDGAATSPLGGVATFRRADFEGVVEDSDVRLGDTWGLAAPELSYAIAGLVTFDHATGHVADDRSRVAFRDAAVRFEGSGAVEPRGGTYDGAGNWSVRVDGVPVAADPAGGPAAGPAILVTGGVLAWLVVSLFTRIAPARLLDHPRRRRILDLARSDPGLPKRELHRRVGGSWSAFLFHLDLLRRAGYVRIDRQGPYTLVRAADFLGRDVPIPHAVQRAVFDGIPTDGSPVSVKELRTSLSLSRQLVTYHLDRLAALGLVRTVEARGRGRFVGRIPRS